MLILSKHIELAITVYIFTIKDINATKNIKINQVASRNELRSYMLRFLIDP